jgi:hypothetical protein
MALMTRRDPLAVVMTVQFSSLDGRMESLPANKTVDWWAEGIPLWLSRMYNLNCWKGFLLVIKNV